jgi:hypothetical protein
VPIYRARQGRKEAPSPKTRSAGTFHITLPYPLSLGAHFSYILLLQTENTSEMLSLLSEGCSPFVSLSGSCFNWQGKPEGRAMTRITLDPNTAVMTLDERPAQI